MDNVAARERKGQQDQAQGEQIGYLRKIPQFLPLGNIFFHHYYHKYEDDGDGQVQIGHDTKETSGANPRISFPAKGAVVHTPALAVLGLEDSKTIVPVAKVVDIKVMARANGYDRKYPGQPRQTEQNPADR